MVELVSQTLDGLCLIRRNEEGLIQQGELPDLRLTFLVTEETAPADDLGDLRGHHLVPGFVPLSDALEDVP
jgi:hypothetical protein